MALTTDVIKTSEIEGEKLALETVRSSVAQRLGIDVGGLRPSDRHVDGIVDMLVDVTRGFDEPLTDERLFEWHAALFPSGQSGLIKLSVGAWRTDMQRPMQVVSGPTGRERIHFEAPAAVRASHEMAQFLAWFETHNGIDPLVKSALAHLWFVTIHPFHNGNGRIARAIADLVLTRSEATSRFYSMRECHHQ